MVLGSGITYFDLVWWLSDMHLKVNWRLVCNDEALSSLHVVVYKQMSAKHDIENFWRIVQRSLDFAQGHYLWCKLILLHRIAATPQSLVGEKSFVVHLEFFYILGVSILLAHIAILHGSEQTSLYKIDSQTRQIMHIINELWPCWYECIRETIVALLALICDSVDGLVYHLSRNLTYHNNLATRLCRQYASVTCEVLLPYRGQSHPVMHALAPPWSLDLNIACLV